MRNRSLSKIARLSTARSHENPRNWHRWVFVVFYIFGVNETSINYIAEYAFITILGYFTLHDSTAGRVKLELGNNERPSEYPHKAMWRTGYFYPGSTSRFVLEWVGDGTGAPSPCSGSWCGVAFGSSGLGCVVSFYGSRAVTRASGWYWVFPGWVKHGEGKVKVQEMKC